MAGTQGAPFRIPENDSAPLLDPTRSRERLPVPAGGARTSRPPRAGTGVRSAAVAALLAASLWAVGLGPAACSRGDGAARIRALVAEGAARAERHDLAGLLQLTAEGFRAEPGDRGREEVREALAGALYYYGKFRLLYPEPVVDLSEDGLSATATVYFLVLRRERSYPGLETLYLDPQGWLAKVGENADLYHLVVHLARTGEEWTALSARLTGYRPGPPPAGAERF